jgi:hypothetical protein
MTVPSALCDTHAVRLTYEISRQGRLNQAQGGRSEERHELGFRDMRFSILQCGQIDAREEMHQRVQSLKNATN